VRGIIDSQEQLVIAYGRHQMTIEKVVRKTTVDAQGNDLFYWQTQPYAMHLAALEQIRREFHIWKYGAEPRFQRVLTITRR
jgi:hypothetical protein